MNVGNQGVITINDRIQSPSSTPLISNIAAAIVISQGANGEGAYTAKGTQNDATTAGSDEKANMPPASFSSTGITPPATLGPYYKREYSDNPSSNGGAFDDVVMILNPGDILTPLIKNGSLKSAEAQWAEQVTNIKNYVVDQILSSSASCSVPSAISSSSYAIGPWGETVGYGTTTTLSPLKFSKLSSTSTTPIYTLTDTSAIPTAPHTIDGPTVGWLFGAYPNLQTLCP